MLCSVLYRNVEEHGNATKTLRAAEQNGGERSGAAQAGSPRACDGEELPRRVDAGDLRLLLGSVPLWDADRDVVPHGLISRVKESGSAISYGPVWCALYLVFRAPPRT